MADDNNKKIVLHACCAPCASYPIKKLIEDNFKPVVFFYNPNIYPVKEYETRFNELKHYCALLGIDFYWGEYNIKKFYENIRGYELEKEGGKRCQICFYMRLFESAVFAKKIGVENFTTTLSVSPHKNTFQLFEAAKYVESQTGVRFVEYNFKKQDGFKISRQIAREYNMYAQSYCGCEFSMR